MEEKSVHLYEIIFLIHIREEKSETFINKLFFIFYVELQSATLCTTMCFLFPPQEKEDDCKGLVQILTYCDLSMTFKHFN